MDTDEDFTTDNPPTSPSTALPSQSPIDQSEIDNLLVEYPYAAEPSYFTRPNRYHGPPSTWRSWTANDRDVADSLDIARASDLSVHLYNAFDLKRRARADQVGTTTQAENGNEAGEDADDGQVVASQQFTPPDVWTAWPLRSRRVPRDTPSGNHAPSTSLAEALVAISLRHAKETWEARGQESKPQQPKSSKHDWKDERDLTKKGIKAQDADDEDHDSSSSSSSAALEENSNTDNAAALTGNLPPGVQLFSSQAFAIPESSSSEDDASTAGSDEDVPIFSADDDNARNLLQPTIRHILTQFDDLLDGLHQARAAYANKGYTSRSRSRSRFSGAETAEDDQFVRSGSRAASVKRGRKRKRAPSEYLVMELEQSSRSRGRSTVREAEKKPQPLALRDWSDVMGMALLKGWNVDTVARASERCARLFGQNMAFRTFHQNAQEKNSVQQEGPYFEETLAYVPTYDDPIQDSSHDSHSDLPSTKPTETEYMRTSSRCSRCESLKIRCQPVNPTTIDNLKTRVSCSSCTSLTNLGMPCTGILVQPRPTSSFKTCPYPDCPRHNPSKPFAKQYHLQRHLTDVHGHIYSPPTSPAPSTPTSHYLPEQIRLNTTLTCPVGSCPQSHRVYKRSTRLYDHIRRAHPEFDVDSLKKIVARRGERGRYDRSRSRSKHNKGNDTDADANANADNDEAIREMEDKNDENTEDQGGTDEDAGDSDHAMQHMGR